MGNITETTHFEKLQEESDRDTMQEDEKLVFEEQFGNDKDKCVICNEDSLYYKTMPIILRLGYIKGSGQLCLDCYVKVYGLKWNRGRLQRINDEQDS